MWSFYAALAVLYNAHSTKEVPKYLDTGKKWALEYTSTINPDWGGSNGVMIKHVHEDFEVGYSCDIELHSHSIVIRKNGFFSTGF